MLGACAAIVLVTGSCIEDPLSDLDGNPAAVVSSHGLLVLAPGEEEAITVRAVDGRSTPLGTPVTVTPCDADVVVTEDQTYAPVPRTSQRFVVTAVNSGASCVQMTSGGAVDTVAVGVLPTAFGGTLSSNAGNPNDTVTISSTNELKFDTSVVTVTFGGAAAAAIVSKTPDQLRVLVPWSNAGPLTISGVDVTYVPGLRASLATTASFTPGSTNPFAGASSWQTAPDITNRLPAAAGQTSHLIVTRGADNVAVCPELSFGSAGPCMMFRYTVGAPTALNFTTDWEGTAAAPDVDIYVCADTVVANLANDCFVDGGSGATGAKPQTTGNDTYPAGTYWLVVEVYDGAGPRNAYVTITRP
jgi:hypothetical protein